MKTKLMTIIMVFPLILFAQNGQKNFIDQNFIEVTGKSELRITPDLIYVKIMLSEKDEKGKNSLQQNESNLVKKLTELGVDVKKDLMISDISSNFKYYLLSKNDILLTKEYMLVLHDTKMVSRVFLDLEKIGISNVSIDRTDNTKMEDFRREAKEAAIIAAKEKAEYLTKAIGQNIGRAIYIQEVENNFTINNPGTSNTIQIRGTGSIYGSNAPEVEFEKIILSYSVICRFELK